MEYKKAFFFVTNCLLLKVKETHKSELIIQIKSGTINWGNVVRVASNHLVVPLLYVRLKEADLLSLLPEDLRVYLLEIHQLNSARNKVLLEEIHQLNQIFEQHNIQVIYLKGAAHLLKGLYKDIGERMIGDIDLLVNPIEMEYVAGVLLSNGFKTLSEYDSSLFTRTKHYPRLIHPTKDFAVEIHKDVIQKVEYRLLDFSAYDKGKVKTENFYIPCIEHLIIHNVLNTQLNDFGSLLSSLNFRQQYDLLLLSREKNIEDVIQSVDYFNNTMMAYLVKTAFLFKAVPSLAFKKSKRSKIQTYFLEQRFNYPSIFKFINQITYAIYKVLSDSRGFVLNMFHTSQRTRMINHFTDPVWFKAYFTRFFNKLKSI
jgi:hypothetical protein